MYMYINVHRYGEHGLNPGSNLTHQPCDRNETLCVTLYDGYHNDTWFSCFDPADQDGKFAQENVCYEDTIFCDQGYHGERGREDINMMS